MPFPRADYWCEHGNKASNIIEESVGEMPRWRALAEGDVLEQEIACERR